ncbi:hypothetical protein [Companilactobacillus furfuricola]|uniref:hypothetical protein n=1 Tax=Companilactobacillus furfuricola TaxID=1462575 RepID=UPI001B86883C|nr:hypothetical protein [Companilactobacillus furfuricola]
MVVLILNGFAEAFWPWLFFSFGVEGVFGCTFNAGSGAGRYMGLERCPRNFELPGSSPGISKLGLSLGNKIAK